MNARCERYENHKRLRLTRRERRHRCLYGNIPGVITPLVPFYNQIEPTLGGFPFFFWFILALVPFTTLCIYGAHKLGVR